MNSAARLSSLISALFPGPPAGKTSPSAPEQASGAAPASAVTYTPGNPRAWQPTTAAGPLVYTRQQAAGGQGGQDANAAPADSKANGAGPAGDQTPTTTGPGSKTQTPAAALAPKKANGQPLTQEEQAVIRELQKTDQAVKTHELAHLAAAGGYAMSGASYTYQRGPNGQSYAVAGEVQIDTSRERNPEATIQKMQVVRQAALAPADPSPQDQRVAAQATLQIAASSQELQQTQAAQAAQRARQAAQPSSSTADQNQGTTTQRGVDQQAGQGLIQGRSTPSPPPALAARRFAAGGQSAPPAGRLSVIA